MDHESFSATTASETNSKFWETNFHRGQSPVPSVWSAGEHQTRASRWDSSRCSQATAGQRPADPGGAERGSLGPALTVQRNQDRLHPCVPENQAGSRKRLLDHMSGRRHSKKAIYLDQQTKESLQSVPHQFAPAFHYWVFFPLVS